VELVDRRVTFVETSLKSFLYLGESKMKRYISGFSAPVVGVLVLGLMTAAIPAIAHHAFSAEFDSTKPVSMSGIVTKIEWTNPHVWFYVDVADESGTFESWGFEMGPPHLLQGRGWTRTTMNIGDEVAIDGSLARNGTNRVNARTVVMVSTGERLGAGSSQNRTP
jgi:hypothetical protein